jgi:hypothetical protein
MHSTRRAYIEIAAACLADIGPLMDAGLEVIASAQSESLGVIKLLIAGDSLPEECETSRDACLTQIPTVTVELTHEAYGRQRIVKVTKITAHKAA